MSVPIRVVDGLRFPAGSRAGKRCSPAQRPRSPSTPQAMLAGLPLFIRGHRGVELTDAGRALLEHARLLLQLSERAVESTRLAVRGKKGLLKVGTPAGGIHARGKELLRLFQSRRPDVQVEIHPGYGPQNIEELARRALDVAIVIAPFDRPEALRYLRLGKEELILAIP